MKEIVFLSIIVLISLSIESNSAFGIPECHEERDLDILWPCQEDKTKYFQCIDIHEHVLMPCGVGTWFDFRAQSCKRPSEWQPPFPQPNPGPKPTPEVDPEPETETEKEPEINSEEDIEAETEDDSEIEIQPTKKKPSPPIVKKTTKHFTPPTIGRSKRTTRKPYPTPSTPPPSAPTEETDKRPKPSVPQIINSTAKVTKKQRATPKGGAPKVPPQAGKTKDIVEEDKEKRVIKKKKQKVSPPTKSS